MTTAELLRRIDQTVSAYEASAEARRATSAREARQSPTEARNCSTGTIPTQTQERTANNA